MNITEIKTFLKNHSDEKYSAFIKRLNPTINYTYGVRAPILREYCKTIVKENQAEEFLTINDFSSRELELMQAYIIGSIRCSISERIVLIKNFLPKVHCWEVNDALCQHGKLKKNELEEVFSFISSLNEKSEFVERYVAVMINSYFLTENYVDTALELLKKLKNSGYYTQMAVSWALATSYTFFPEKTYNAILSGDFDKWIINKAVNKIRESFRVSAENKEKVSLLKASLNIEK